MTKPPIKMTIKLIPHCALCILATSVALNAQLEWNNQDADGDWNTPASWAAGAVPTATDFAKINGGNATVASVTTPSPAGAVIYFRDNGDEDVSRTAGTYTVTDAAGNASGTGADFTVVVDAEGKPTVTLVSGGIGYTDNETITIADSSLGSGGGAAVAVTVTVVDATYPTVANKLVTGGTTILTVDSGGFLATNTDFLIGEAGNPDVNTKTGTVQLNVGGQILANTLVQVGGWSALGQESFLNIAGGTLTIGTELRVGSGSAGVLNLSGGTVDLSTESWHSLRIGDGVGDGTVNITGGTLTTYGMRMNQDGTGNASLNLDGGTLTVNGNFSGSIKTGSNIAISDGVLEWQGNRTSDIDARITSGEITFANSTTSGNYPDETPEQTWISSDGAVTLYADYNEIKVGYTTVWAESNDTDGDGYNNSVDVFPDDATEWLDTDGDNVGDNGDAHPGFDDSALTTYLTTYLADNNYIVDDGTSGGLTEQDLIDLRVGSQMAAIANEEATLQVVIEQSDDLGSWSTLQTESVTVPAPAGTSKQFFRYRMQD